MSPLENSKDNDLRLEDIGFRYEEDDDDPKLNLNHPVIEIFDTEEDLNIACEELIMSSSRDNIALSGGSAKYLYEFISKNNPKDFETTTFWQVDERFVDSDHEHSNNLLIHQYFLENLTDYEDFIYFDTEEESIADILDSYESEFDEKEIPEKGFKTVILGVGPDGHTASIFPNTKAIEENDKTVLHTKTEVFDIEDRFTLTFPAILNSDKVIIYLPGSSKEEIFRELTESEKSVQDLPAKKLLEHPNLFIFWGNF